MALRAVDEDRDSQKVVADCELAAGEDRPGRNAELVIAALALEQLARLVGVDRGAAALGAKWLAVSGGPTDQLEGLIGFLVRPNGRPSLNLATSPLREKEVLRHETNVFR